MKQKTCKICLGNGWYMDAVKDGLVKVGCAYCHNLGQEVTVTPAPKGKDDSLPDVG